jgi:UDP-3-O-acyl N-acetylglucosamine deacetylase
LVINNSYLPALSITAVMNPRSNLRRQQTLAQPALVQGFGYWSGRDIRVEFRPAPIDTGLVFVRADLPRSPRIPVHVSQRVEMPRRTSLVADGASVEMVEHVVAALQGLQVDNCEIVVDGIEMPGCDGSCQAFVEAIDQAGIIAQEAIQPRLVITETTRVGNEQEWVEARPAPKGAQLSIRYKLDYGPNTPIGKQSLDVVVTPQSFRRELASARTFVLAAEAQWLRERGLGQRVTPQDLLIFAEEGVVDNELRFENECVRHKALDLVGDLGLAGCEVVGQIIAYRSGHRLNAELVKVLLQEGRKEAPRRRSA